jgi:DNA invertase Pin-like site-specific DNA recombinase
MLVGYARVSTTEQNLDLQHDALEQAHCGRIFTDTVSSAKDDRPGLTQALSFVREGDTLIVWKLDRLGRTMKGLILLIEELKTRGIHFKSIQDNIDTTTPAGQLFFHMNAAYAQYERDIIRERTHAGLKAARARGRQGGRPRKLTGKRAEMAVAMLNDPTNDIDDICDTFGVSRPTLYRLAAAAKAANPPINGASHHAH